MSELEIDARKIEIDLDKQKLREMVAKKLAEYQKTLSYMAADAPISILCLPKGVEGILFRNGLLRVYDLFDCDFTKIEGLNAAGVGNLTASLEKFLSML